MESVSEITVELDAPADAQWLAISTPVPINRSDDLTVALLELESGGAFARPLATRPFATLHGFQFMAYGFVTADSAGRDDAQPWEIGPREWRGAHWDGFTFNVRRMIATWPDAPLCAARYWLPGQQIADTIERLRGGAIIAEWRRAVNALEGLTRFSERLRTSGRRRLKDNPSHPWRYYADQAVEIQKAEPFLGLEYVVERLGLTDEEGTDRTRTLRRWIAERQQELEEKGRSPGL